MDTNKRHVTYATLTAALGLGFIAPVALAQQDATFLTDAMSGDLAEMQLGRLAQERGQSAQVREFGERLVHDHEDAMRRTAEIAELEGVAPPRAPMPDAQEAYRRLSELSGAEFDREFTNLMIANHAKQISKFEQQAAREDVVGSTDATEHAKDRLPRLREHLEIAQSIDQTLTR